MKIKVKLIAVVVPGPSPAATNREVVVDLPDGATPNDALAALGLSAAEPYVTIVNDETVSPDARDRHHMKADDSLTIFPPIKGG